ncbi:tudor domain-containing protein 1 [Chaetodon trifascialis]|uniref:tudor domain-containing protein 1 n=1 Tax=Chaetodon trifascialis TaxID=109706 RepID=UPI003996434F
MYPSFSPNLVRLNQPLRKPSSSPLALCAAPPMADVRLVSSMPDASGDTPVSGSLTQAVFCSYCGEQGSFRCKRCKKRPYCSVVCQTKDWKAHCHMCKSIDSEPKETPEETGASPVNGAVLSESKDADTNSHQRVYFKDLHVAKVIKGADIQASVLEFYSPGRFFALAQSPELLEALQLISAELRKTYCSLSPTTYVPCVGEVCAVQFSCDMNWYRGLVQTLATDKKIAYILYIDFGNEEHVPLDRIRPLAANIPPFCPCAMECRIAGVVPVAGNWSGECCIAVRQMLAGKSVTIKLVETPEYGRIHVVDILLSMGKQLSAFLLECGYAAKETDKMTPTEQEIRAMVSTSLENFRRCADGKDDNTWAQPPKPMIQAVGDSLSVVVTHLQSPNEIIVQKVENAGVIQELQLKLREHCSQVPAPQNFRPAPGTVCCVQFSEDKQWYRAKVLAYPSEERICVGYLDFGNSEEVDLDHLRPISPSLLALPMQAMPCGLAGVRPDGESWSEECLLALQRRVSNRILHIEIQGAHEGKALVTMIDKTSDPQANIAELLTSGGFTASALVTAGSDQQADQTTTAAAKPHVPDPASEPLVWSWPELPTDGQRVALLASVLENPRDFYCRINRSTDHQRLIEMSAELKQHCEANASPFVPKVGEPCCAMFPGDGAWYRAMVNGLSEDKVSIVLVDYGFSMEVQKDQLQSITPRLLSLPFQSIHCRLAGVEPLGSEWNSEAILHFQNLVDGEQLSARVLSVSEQGYDVELESRGKDVAASLISMQLAKAPGAIPEETRETTGCEAKHQDKIQENERSQMNAQASDQTRASSKDIPTLSEGQLESPSFPLDWKTVELPLKETFQPHFAAVISPSLFYLLSASKVDQQKFQGLMMELAAYCSNNQASLSSAVLSRPDPGAACCAQFSGDSNWYRAVVLEVGENDISVIYADYGNTEKVPFSRILPIPMHLLQLPFQISRCTLTGKEHFPAEWPKEVHQMVQSQLLNGVLATVESFDGSANVLSLTPLTETGRGHLTAMILDALQAQAKSNPCPSTTQRAEQTDTSTSTANTTAVPESIPETQEGLESTRATTGLTVTPEPAPQTPQQEKNTSAVSVNAPQTSGCCCLSLKTKIDRLEQLVQLQLSLIKQLVGQTKKDSPST